MKLEKKYQVTVVGYGNRGQVYADYSLEEPEELEVVAVVDPNPFKLEEAKLRYGLTEDQVFLTWDAFLKKSISCDIVINATMDQHHYETAMEILEAGYDMLLEKPVVPTKEQLMDIANLAKEKNAKVFICHVLRYTPFYSKVKEILNAGTLGDIVTIEMNEHVNRYHYLTSYVRGKWNSEEACGSGFILAKCCHDLDIMCWLNNVSVPKKIVSFGNRSQFIPEKAPEGATEYCHQCPHVDTCIYSAKEMYLEKNVMPFLVWDRLNKPLDSISMEEKEEFLKKDIYGKCAFTCGGDIVDRQNLIVSFENGSVATFDLSSGSQISGRYLHIVGTMGEIEGNLETDKFVLRTYNREEFFGDSEEIEVHPINNAKYGGHNGGDYMIMHDLVRYLGGDRSSVSITSLDDSINGHLCIYAAEKSRKENTIVEI